MSPRSAFSLAASSGMVTTAGQTQPSIRISGASAYGAAAPAPLGGWRLQISGIFIKEIRKLLDGRTQPAVDRTMRTICATESVASFSRMLVR